MSRYTLKHLPWVLCLWLLLVDVRGEDGATSKSEKHLFIKQESGPKGGSLVHSFVSTRTSRAFTSTSSFDDGSRTDKPPDDRQSTIRFSNDTVDLSKNTVPVLKYPIPTESSLKEKYWRTTEGPETTPLKKSHKLKRNMTRSRPSDLTTLLVYNALTPGRYPSTTQVAESMPPTAWALATLKEPGPSANIKPFISWSTRLSKQTAPPPVTEVTEQVAELETTIQPEMSGFDTTAPGNEEIETSTLNNESTSPISNTEAATPPMTTEKPTGVTTFEPEENTISVPPLASLKNTTPDQANIDLSILLATQTPKNVTSVSSHDTNDANLSTYELQQNSVMMTEENKNSTPSVIQQTSAKTRLNETTLPEDIVEITEENNAGPLKTTDYPIKKTVQEIDPSINTIHEKKHDQVSTSTVVSTVNSSITVQVTSVLNGKSSNLTNVIDIDQKVLGDKSEFTKNLPLTVEATTLSNTVSHSPHPPKVPDQGSTLNEANQTGNDIKVITKNKKITPMSSDNLNIETPSTLKSNEIKPEPVSTNNIKDSNLTEYKIESFHNYVQELPETTQSNDIQDHDQIKPINNKTLIQHFISENSSETQKSPAPSISIPSTQTLHSTNTPKVNVTLTPFTTVNPNTPNNYSVITNATVSDNEISTTLLPMTTPLLAMTIIPNTLLESTTTISSTSPTSLNATNSSPSPTSTMTNIPTTDRVVVTTNDTPASVASKSNEIKVHEIVTEVYQLTPKANITSFDVDLRNSVKNDTSFVFRESEEDDEDTLSYNHTDISDKRGSSDTISNNDNEDDSDDLLEASVNVSIATIVGNSSKEPTTTLLPITFVSSLKPTTSVSDDTTIIDEDHGNIDDDTLYDTGVIMTIYVRLVIQATYHELCKNKDLLKDSIVKVFKNYAERTINRRQVMITNLGVNDCSSFRAEMEPRLIPVHIILTNTQGQYDKGLNDLFISLARQKNLDFKYPISQVEKVQQETLLETESQISGTMVAAIIISSIAAVCLFALTILLVIMRKRQTGFNYGQRCTPVSLDDYSLDNISVYNSVRRKALRASKRSYGNPAFDDPDAISNPVNFAGLANMASDKSKTDEEFSSLPQVVVKPDELPPGAEIKNRYANVIPIPETRVQLRAPSPEDQFINANYVKGAKGAEKFYIACQAPLQSTIEDFWRMVWYEQSRLIIMLTALTENGVEKCADYLPPSEVLDCHRVFGDLQVTLKKREAREKYVISSLQLKNLDTNLWREVTHMWYAGWPPTGVPPEPSSVIAFLIEARSYSKSSPIIVHCSPGTGRTGTVIAIDIAIRDFEAGRSVDIPKTVVQVRRGRAGAVQTKDQYSFIYKVLHLYATKLTGGGLDSI